MAHDTDDSEKKLPSAELTPAAELSPPEYEKLRIYGDESGTHGAPYSGYGIIVMPHERRGDFLAMVAEVRKRHGYDGELKWSKIGRFNEAFAAEMISEFFKRPWLMFHGLIVRRGYVDLGHHHGDRDLAFRKHFAMLLTTKMKWLADGRKKAFYVIIDPLPSRYAKADEAAHKIIGHTLRRDAGPNVVIETLVSRDSKLTAGIQLADLLMGATLAPWQDDITAEPKKRISRLVAMHLGWPDMRADTYPSESKFNLWYFHDPTAGHAREVRTRPVRLLYPMTPFRKRHR